MNNRFIHVIILLALQQIHCEARSHVCCSSGLLCTLAAMPRSAKTRWDRGMFSQSTAVNKISPGRLALHGEDKEGYGNLVQRT